MYMYKLICPRISPHGLKKEDIEVLKRVFRKFGGTGLKLKAMEADFLRENPAYAQGCKRKHNAKEAPLKVMSTGLLANMPDGFAENAELQEKIRTRFADFVATVKGDFAAAGIEDLTNDQVDSLMVGHMVHQYGAKGPFGVEE